jgi:hypothetical protein
VNQTLAYQAVQNMDQQQLLFESKPKLLMQEPKLVQIIKASKP